MPKEGARAPLGGLAASLYAFAVVSGFAALVYQVAWSNLLALSFGSSAKAASAVVAGFLGGMGIGAWLYHRVGERVPSPLRAYAGLEAGIAVATAVFTALFASLPAVIAATGGALPRGLATDLGLAGGVILLLAVPSALMGATYPALCMALIRSREGVDRHLGVLYGLNTLGAAAGAAVGGFVLIEQLGARGSVYLANTLNLAVALGALGVARRSGPGAAAPPPADEALAGDLPAWLTALVLVVSGCATLGYEILWFRALRYVVGNSTYSLSAVLVVFLLGLGFGSLLWRPLQRLARPERILAVAQLATAVLALAAIAALHAILANPAARDALSIFSPVLRARPWWWRLGVGTGVALAMMLPATLCMGLAFPLATRLHLGSVRRLGARVGSAYLLSNLGSIAGALGASLWLLPHLGSVGGTKLFALANLALGVLVLAFGPAGGRRAWVAGAAAAATVGLALRIPGTLPLEGEPFFARLAPRVVFQEEAELGTVQVRQAAARPEQRLMTIDGSLIAVARDFLPDLYRKQVLLAHLPMILDPSARETLNVGIASCSSVAALARHQDVEILDAVEINPAVLQAAPLFLECEVLRDSRVQVVVEDAVHYLLRTPRRYDLVISDAKQNRDFSGNAKILSREFYGFASARLAECGIFAQWIPLTNDPASFDLILRTFRAAFPHVEIFVDPPASTYMLGSRCPIAGRERMDAEAFDRLGLAEDLAPHGLHGPDDVLALWAASGADLDAVPGPGPVNDWDRMPVAFASYRAQDEGGATARNLALLFEGRERRGATSPFEVDGSPQSRSRPLAQRALLAAERGDDAEAARLAREALRENPADPIAPRVLAGVRARAAGARP